MSKNNQLSIKILNEEIQIGSADDIPLSVNYEIEDEQDFRQKKSGTGLNISIPATTNNSRKLSGLYDPGSMDTTPNQQLSKPMDAVIISAGEEFYKGKAFATKGRKVNDRPHSFDINFFGDNADWVIPLKETTLIECLNPNSHVFDKATMESSWAHDGTNENNDYVYAPMRSRESFGEPFGNDTPDKVFRPINSRPALFLYWILIRGFRLAGYKVQSTFMESPEFKRMVLLWTWGNFFYITDRLLKEMGFLATGPVTIGIHGDGSAVGINGAGPTTPAYSWLTCNQGGYTGSFNTTSYAQYSISDNNLNWRLNNVSSDIGYVGNPLEYSHNDATGESTWTYLPAYGSLGLLTIGFEIRLSATIDCSFNSNAYVDIEVYKSGVLYQTFNSVFTAQAPALGTAIDFGTRDTFIKVTNLSPGDTVSIKIKYHVFKSSLGFCFLKILGTGDQIRVHPFSASQPREDVRSYFKLSYIRRQLGSIIEWNKFDRFKEFKWLDLLRGCIDDFNLQINTDPMTKTVVIEPTHRHNRTGGISNPTQPGFFNGNIIDWTKKRDLSAESVTEIFQDYERDVLMRMKDDPNDGLLKLLQDRTQTNMTGIKYLFPERFKKGQKDMENRFFSGVVHYLHDEWKNITGVSPQLIALIPENISNTSNPESESTFQPKLAFYKGVVDRNTYGGWNWDGDTSKDLPYMFAVNYKPGGENDPILTYNDQRIGNVGGPYVLGFGLFKRYFWQRFAIMREGKRFSAPFRLNNSDVIGTLHREFKAIENQRFQLLNIRGYQPLTDVPCEVTLWKFYPITAIDGASTFPSVDSVQNGITTGTDDISYSPLIALFSDIPQYIL